MAKCDNCGKSLFLSKKVQLKDAVICGSCSKALGVDRFTYPEVVSLNELNKEITIHTQTLEEKPAPKNEYFFLVHDLDEDFIEKYRKEETDHEDLWEGMSFNDIRETCDEDDKIYKYPELDVYLEFKESTLDGNPALEVYLDDHMVGYVPKTKVNKTKKLLADNVDWSAELYGGDYRYLKGTYVDEWFDKVNIRVTFTW